MSVANWTRWIGAAHRYRDAHIYHSDHRKRALRIAGVISKQNGSRLTKKLKRIVDEYSSDVFGSRKYAPWLYVYTLVRGKFVEGWIPDNFFGRSVVPVVNKKLRCWASSSLSQTPF